MPVYLKLGSIQGAATSSQYKNWIEIDAYSWGFSVAVQTTSGSTGNRVSSGKVTPGDLHLTKKQDDSTTQMMMQSLQGKNTDSATLAVTRQSNDGGEQKYMEYVMSNVICSSFTTSGTSSGGSQPSENITLNFTKLELNQYVLDASGQPRAMRGGVDFTQNTTT
jgi:type VI secretion system Hcp family effector